jgi:hypothetical protein
LSKHHYASSGTEIFGFFLESVDADNFFLGGISRKKHIVIYTAKEEKKKKKSHT